MAVGLTERNAVWLYQLSLKRLSPDSSQRREAGVIEDHPSAMSGHCLAILQVCFGCLKERNFALKRENIKLLQEEMKSLISFCLRILITTYKYASDASLDSLQAASQFWAHSMWWTALSSILRSVSSSYYLCMYIHIMVYHIIHILCIIMYIYIYELVIISVYIYIYIHNE